MDQFSENSIIDHAICTFYNIKVLISKKEESENGDHKSQMAGLK